MYKKSKQTDQVLRAYIKRNKLVDMLEVSCAMPV